MASRHEDEVADLLGEPRPQDPKAELKKLLLDWVAKGKTVYAFCRQPGTPCVRTIYNWLDKDLIFSEQFRTAKAVGYDIMSQQCLDIADAVNAKNVRQQKLRIWTRLQLLARWDSKRYGSKIVLGGDVDNPIRVMDDAEVAREVARLLAKAKMRQLSDPNYQRSRELLN